MEYLDETGSLEESAFVHMENFCSFWFVWFVTTAISWKMSKGLFQGMKLISSKTWLKKMYTETSCNPGKWYNILHAPFQRSRACWSNKIKQNSAVYHSLVLLYFQPVSGMSFHTVDSDGFAPIDLNLIDALCQNKWSNQWSDINAQRWTLLFTTSCMLSSEAEPPGPLVSQRFSQNRKRRIIFLVNHCGKLG